MGRLASKRFQRGFALALILGLFPLALFLIWWFKPKQVIKRSLKRNNIDPQTIKYWTAVSAYETRPQVTGAKPWTSRVFKDSNNLFNLIIPNSKRLAYGEGQTIFPSTMASADALYNHVIKPFKYSLYYASIGDLVAAMKAKGYFEQSEAQYRAGVEQAYKTLYA